MTKGILGKKVGMTQIFTESGELIPVTVVEATPNVVLTSEKLLKRTATKLFKLVTKTNVKFYQTNLRKVMLQKQTRLLSASFVNSKMLS